MRVVRRGKYEKLSYGKSLRERIESGLNAAMRAGEIARCIDKDPSTVIKEVKLRREPANNNYFNRMNCKSYQNKEHCFVEKMRKKSCDSMLCKFYKINVAPKCEYFILRPCPKLAKWPYVCNGCPEKNCSFQKNNLFCHTSAKSI